MLLLLSCALYFISKFSVGGTVANFSVLMGEFLATLMFYTVLSRMHFEAWHVGCICSIYTWEAEAGGLAVKGNLVSQFEITTGSWRALQGHVWFSFTNWVHLWVFQQSLVFRTKGI